MRLQCLFAVVKGYYLTTTTTTTKKVGRAPPQKDGGSGKVDGWMPEAEDVRRDAEGGRK